MYITQLLVGTVSRTFFEFVRSVAVHKFLDTWLSSLPLMRQQIFHFEKKGREGTIRGSTVTSVDCTGSNGPF